jgi:hypothetical protein
MLFKSPNTAIYLSRGVCGFGLLTLSVHYSYVLGWWTIVPGVAALVCLGGCPMCWVVGLFETALRGRNDRQLATNCSHCELPRRATRLED